MGFDGRLEELWIEVIGQLPPPPPPEHLPPGHIPPGTYPRELNPTGYLRQVICHEPA